MNYTVIGTGAIGGFYGARLKKAGKDVRFLQAELRFLEEDA